MRLTISDADFSWRAGQHAYLTIPRLRPLELHPFTIANAPVIGDEKRMQSLTMLIKARSGFSKTLRKAAERADGHVYRAFLSGPWGVPPDLRTYETVVLIACSSGASFIVPLLEAAVRDPACVRRVKLHWIVRSAEHFAWYGDTVTAALQTARGNGLLLQISVHVTSTSAHARMATEILPATTPSSASNRSEQGSSSASLASVEDEKTPLSGGRAVSGLHEGSSMKTLRNGRPSVEEMIRPAVETALGETAVVVCGGVSITAQARTFVAALSDERAVHKGTGAQGIYLFSETYGW